MKEVMRSVSHQQASQLLHNKFVVVLGDSIHRSIYKDLVLLLQKEKYLTVKQLKSKGEMSFEQDCLVEGGCLDSLHNGTTYREVRQFQAPHHLVRFYFVTRIFSRYMQSVLEDFRQGLTPDVIIVNSCVWDVSRYSVEWVDEYRENLNTFFEELRWILPQETLIIWNLTMPLGESIKGGFLVPEIRHKAPNLWSDVIEANFYSGTLADAHGVDVLDLHFQFRLSLHHRITDGIHWNAIAHRRITFLLLRHIAQAWGVILPSPLTTLDLNDTNNQPDSRSETKTERHPTMFSNMSGDYQHNRFESDWHRRYGFEHGLSDHHERYRGHHHRDLMRSRHYRRQHYAPYPHHNRYDRHGHYY
ncbi:PC-esterase domain-containing protein 1A [Parambassis ranga]|uniref:PC-esterase domain-containing protein 1A n=1 Tax=Parambassis ranga TaxID=210632 RepID=A0A6P7K6X5_9TELE|nr:PC-esterase domain-containing protein 1A-like [Parambassis ranga]